MGTEKTLSAVIEQKTNADMAAPPLGYAHQKVTYSGDRIIRDAKVKLFRAEFPDGIKIAVEALVGQTIFSFHMATRKTASDPETYAALAPQTGSAAELDIDKLSKVVAPRSGYKWNLFHGDYPDAQKRLFSTRIELAQVSGASTETLRLAITYTPNTWSADNHFLLETDSFATHHP